MTKLPDTIWATPHGEGYESGMYCPPKPHMKGGPPNGDATSYTITALYDEVVAERDRLREALEFYACADDCSSGRAFCVPDIYEIGKFKCGGKARAALAPKGDEL